MTEDSGRYATRQDIERLSGEVTALERCGRDEIRDLADRVLTLEHYHANELPRLRALECKRERDERRIMLAGWGIAFAVIGVVLDIFVRVAHEPLAPSCP